MSFQTLISTQELADHVGDPTWVIVDCRFAIAQPDLGRQNYELGHIPGAVYALLDEDLSAPMIRGKTGRHPLPTVEAAADFFGRLGIEPGIQVVAYDDLGGAIAAARCWWLLRWLGHTAVAVLDGGWQAWRGEDRPIRGGVEANPRREFHPQVNPSMAFDIDQVEAVRLDAGWAVIDSRAVDRYRGENETIDPVAGHIPGARSAPYAENLDANGTFLPKARLRERFELILGDIPAEQAVFYCGSGVSAAHNILAMLHAGLGEARLYPGSWSEWITDPQRPVERGAEKHQNH